MVGLPRNRGCWVDMAQDETGSHPALTRSDAWLLAALTEGSHGRKPAATNRGKPKLISSKVGIKRLSQSASLTKSRRLTGRPGLMLARRTSALAGVLMCGQPFREHERVRLRPRHRAGIGTGIERIGRPVVCADHAGGSPPRARLDRLQAGIRLAVFRAVA